MGMTFGGSHTERDYFELTVTDRDGAFVRKMTVHFESVTAWKNDWTSKGFKVTVKNHRGVDVTRSF